MAASSELISREVGGEGGYTHVTIHKQHYLRTQGFLTHFFHSLRKNCFMAANETACMEGVATTHKLGTA